MPSHNTQTHTNTYTHTPTRSTHTHTNTSTHRTHITHTNTKYVLLLLIFELLCEIELRENNLLKLHKYNGNYILALLLLAFWQTFDCVYVFVCECALMDVRTWCLEGVDRKQIFEGIETHKNMLVGITIEFRLSVRHEIQKVIRFLGGVSVCVCVN